MDPNNDQQPAPQNYDFIVNPAQQPKQSRFQGTSMPIRVATILGGLIILFILFTIIKGFLSGPSTVDLFLGIAQDQQQILVIAEDAGKQQGLSTVNTNSMTTITPSISTDQAATLAYMSKNGKKVNPKDISLKLNPSTIEQLTASAAAGTYNQTYADVMSQELNAYSNHLQQVYKQVNGKNGRELLTKNYESVQLLSQQLKAQ